MFTITKDDSVTISFKNSKTFVEQGTLHFINTIFEKDTQIYNDVMFEYHILNETSDIVMKFATTSQKDTVKENVLLVGNYTIKQVPIDGYLLENISINEQLFMDTYTLRITKDNITKVIAKNIYEVTVAPVQPSESRTIDTSDTSKAPSVYAIIMLISLFIVGSSIVKKRENSVSKKEFY